MAAGSLLTDNRSLSVGQRAVEARLEAGGDFGALIFVRFLTGFRAKLMAKIFSACQPKRPAARVTPCFHDGQRSVAPLYL